MLAVSIAGQAKSDGTLHLYVSKSVQASVHSKPIDDGFVIETTR